MRLAWLTDLHLNFASQERKVQLVEELKATQADALLVGGDTGEADSFAKYLQSLGAELQISIYFVLGNHDYYRGSLVEVRKAATSLSRGSNHLTWLPERRVVELGKQTALVGHGGWADGRVGNFLEST